MKLLRPALTVATAMVTGLVTATQASAALLPAATALIPLPSFGAVVPDDAHHLLYVSGGRTANSVVAVGYDGVVRHRLDNELGASDLVLSADGTTLYAALATGDAVAAISTADFTENARYPMGLAHSCPANLARTGADIWIGYGCGEAWDAGVAVLDTSAASPKVVLGRQDPKNDVRYSAAPLLAAATTTDAAGKATSTLAVGQPALSPANVAVYRADGATLTLAQSQPRGGSDLTDLAVTPDAATVYTAAGSEQTVNGYATATLADAGAYLTGPDPVAVASSPDGGLLAAATADANSRVDVFRPGTSQPAADYWLPLTGIAVAHGVAFSGDDTMVFVITDRAGDGALQVTVFRNVMTDPTTNAPVAG